MVTRFFLQNIYFLTISLLAALTIPAAAYGQSPFNNCREAINSEQIVELKKILANNPHMVSAITGETPLHYAARNDSSAEIINAIIASGIKVDIRDKNKRTALHLAASPVVAQALIDYGASINPLDRKGNTPLSIASTEGVTDLVSLLLFNGAQPNIANAKHETPLHQAVKGGYIDIARLLILKGADVNSRDEQLQTPIIIAACKTDKAFIPLLMEHGASINDKDDAGYSPIHLAAYFNRIEVAKELIKYGADCSMESGNGADAFQLAASGDGGQQAANTLRAISAGH